MNEVISDIELTMKLLNRRMINIQLLVNDQKSLEKCLNLHKISMEMTEKLIYKIKIQTATKKDITEILAIHERLCNEINKFFI